MASQLSTGFVAATLVGVLWMLIFPILLALVARRRLSSPWRYFWIGALTFFLSQVVTRIPAVQAIGPTLQSAPGLLWTWVLVLALTAGLFEEVGRYVAFRWLAHRERLTWANTVFFGIGHGALEAMLLGAGLTVVSLASMMSMTPETLAALPPEQRGLAEQQLAQAAAAPAWAGLLGAWERMWAMALHVGFSVVVLQAFRRHAVRWLWLAIVAHAAVDFTVGASALLFGRGLSTTVVLEVLVTIYALVAVWATWRLRDSAGPGIPRQQPRSQR
ncbi:MAG: YhfC family intramembrane metalloprotease [Chloroflexota bacterium]|nr:YhfC family intramembrane metalloprotease [Chloroflexota bacterium]